MQLSLYLSGNKSHWQLRIWTRCLLYWNLCITIRLLLPACLLRLCLAFDFVRVLLRWVPSRKRRYLDYVIKYLVISKSLNWNIRYQQFENCTISWRNKILANKIVQLPDLVHNICFWILSIKCQDPSIYYVMSMHQL